ncbi:MAG TPA: 2-oxo-4-hydroxy-4-carboxy-5-ureidoimidazoline decarboxylase [Pyrinomonadaceae bacterium]|nr:2-oxo-4-hydroxy-4-carboxy-5-ureidoimidazoline decarboxylase [Pyrinomonadaceae bacterium]
MSAQTTNRDLASLNSLGPNEAEAEFLKCCGSRQWAQRMVQARPFATADQLTDSAQRVWWSLQPDDWLEAFRSHPKIGEQKAAAKTSVEAQKWSETEQAGVAGSTENTLQSLADLNRDYERKFGYIFIVCASGKSSGEMLGLLRNRMENEPGAELRIAAAEQARITELRLKKLTGV